MMKVDLDGRKLTDLQDFGFNFFCQ